MPLFDSDKKKENLINDVKLVMERVNNLGKEMKLLRKEVEFLSDLAERNQKRLMEQEKDMGKIHKSLEDLLKFLEK